jgi:hypothetical protein
LYFCNILHYNTKLIIKFKHMGGGNPQFIRRFRFYEIPAFAGMTYGTGMKVIREADTRLVTHDLLLKESFNIKGFYSC